jgi:hypothetical protein
VDRDVVATGEGLKEGVVLVLRADNTEFAVAISKEDAMLIAARLTEAALNARADVNSKLGIPSH